MTHAELDVRPTTAKLLADFGDDYLSISSLFRFSFVPGGRLGLLRDLAVPEEWGTKEFVLLRYLAVHLRLAIEQDRYVWNGDQIVLSAGRLTTATGAPLYVGLVRNQIPGENPWVLNWVGDRPNSPELPEPPSLGTWQVPSPGAEVVVACELDGDERRPGVDALNDVMRDAPVVARIAALSGAVAWALHRGIAVRQIHGGGRGYFAPVYLRSREDLSVAPDLVVPLTVQGERVIVRALLEPYVAYAPARAVVERCEQLPPWVLDAWDVAVDAAEGGGA